MVTTSHTHYHTSFVTGEWLGEGRIISIGALLRQGLAGFGVPAAGWASGTFSVHLYCLT
jgi:hypothetical protein